MDKFSRAGESKGEEKFDLVQKYSIDCIKYLFAIVLQSCASFQPKEN